MTPRAASSASIHPARRAVSGEGSDLDDHDEPRVQRTEDEGVVPVTEEEVVFYKRPVAKGEVRIRKEAVEDTEVVEEDVRHEEIDAEDDTERRAAASRGAAKGRSA